MNPKGSIIINPKYFSRQVPPRSTNSLDNYANAIHVNPNFAPNVHFNPKFVHLPTAKVFRNDNYASEIVEEGRSAVNHSFGNVPSSQVQGAINSKYSWKSGSLKKCKVGSPAFAAAPSTSYNPLLGGKFPLPSCTKFVKNNLLASKPISFYKNSIINPPIATSQNIAGGSQCKHKFVAREFKIKPTKAANCDLKSTAVISKNGRTLIRKNAKNIHNFNSNSADTKIHRSPLSKSECFIQSKTKFKIDKRPATLRRRSQHKWRNLMTGSRYKIENLFPKALFHVNKYTLRKISLPIKQSVANKPACAPRVQQMNKAAKFGNRKVVNIGGILYRVSSHKLTRTKDDRRPLNKVAPKKDTFPKGAKAAEEHVIHVRGERFILSRNGATLKRLPGQSKLPRLQARVDFGGVTFKQTTDDILVRTDSHKARILLLQARQRSLATLASRRRKVNTPCMIYHKLGRCRKLERGNCPFTHDKKHVALCKRFLQGLCSEKECLLSHNPVHQKVATCRFFLEGFCTRENCPFLHVKVSGKAGICGPFLQGFCELGQQCSKRHIHICPDFEKTGKCQKNGKCPYPHKKRAIYSEKFQNKKKRNRKKRDTKKQGALEQDSSAGRYYDSVTATSGPVSERLDIVPDRRKLEDLPSFIGFNNI